MRKIPRQPRSQALVDKLIDATGRMIAERGLELTTTNHIADAAGVNIASLYQYFTDKDDLLASLLDKLGRDITQMFTQQLAINDLSHIDLRTFTKAGIGTGLAFLRANELYLELLRHWHRLPAEAVFNHLETYFHQVCSDYFTRQQLAYSSEHLPARLYVLINSVLLITVRYLGNSRSSISEEELVDTLTDMMVLLITHTSTDTSKDVPYNSQNTAQSALQNTGPGAQH